MLKHNPDSLMAIGTGDVAPPKGGSQRGGRVSFRAVLCGSRSLTAGGSLWQAKWQVCPPATLD